MRKLFLDDNRTLDMIYPGANNDEWSIARNYHQFINFIEKFGLPDYISFDHDLGLEHVKFYFNNGGHENPPDPSKTEFIEKTGYDCAKWLVEYCMNTNQKLPYWYVHSHNPVGAENIRRYLKNAEKHLGIGK